MGITAYHVFTSPIADGTNTQLVRPSNWNSAHNLTLNAVGSEISGAFSNANNVTFALETNGFVTASASYPTQTAFVFSNGNGVTFGTNASTVTASVQTNYQAPGAYLTTAAQSDHSHGNPTLALTNLSGTTASNSGGFTLSLSAALGGGAGDGYNILAAGSQTAGNSASVLFNNANGITFGMSNSSVITASHNGLTTARASNDAIGLNSAFTAGPLAMTINSSGLSLNAASAAGTTTGFGGNLISGSMTHNTAGLNLSLNHPAWLTTAAQSNHSHGNPTLALTNINGTTASASNGLTLSLSAIVPAQTVQPVAASGSNGSFAFSTLSFGASNGLTFYTTNGSIVASYTDAGAGGGVAFSAGSTSSNLAAVTFSNSNGVTFGLGTGASAGVITASVNAGGGAATVSTYIPYYPASTGASTLGATGTSTASAHFWPVSVQGPVVFNQMWLLNTVSHVTSSVSGRQSVSSRYGIYSNNAGTLSQISSGSHSYAVTNSSVSATLSYPVSYGTAGGFTYTTIAATTTAQLQSLWGTAGNRIITLGFGGNMTLTEGLYWIGVHQQQSSSSANVGLVPALAGNVMLAAQNAGPMGASTIDGSTGTAAYYKFAWGPHTSTGSLGYSGTINPPSVALSVIANTATIMPMCTFISR